MPQAKLAIACDHAGLELKEAVKKHLAGKAPMNLEVLDLGTNTVDSVDYPDFGAAMGKAITDGKAAMGIVICGSGIGISIAANRFPAVRAALCMNATMARLARQHNDANVLALGARLVGAEIAFDCVDAFLNTKFEGGRHEARVKKLGNCC
ncbi:MAG: ribose 5-phosphate isomerase B [Alphaproteobacteria bacterium]|nr:ribose 5-phosphate isomerase B [Alphaproteobacteria bacterium]